MTLVIRYKTAFIIIHVLYDAIVFYCLMILDIGFILMINQIKPVYFHLLSISVTKLQTYKVTVHRQDNTYM